MTAARRYWKYLMRKGARHPLVALLLALLALFVVSVLVLWLTQEAKTLREVLFMVLLPFLGQGPEDPEMSLASAIVWFSGLLASIGLLAVVTALIVNRFIQICLRGGKVTKRTTESGHVVVCGWNSQGERVTKELLDASRSQSVVILAAMEQRPVPNQDVEFVSGDPTQDRDLRRAGVDRAGSVIVLTDFSSNPNEADAQALLIALAVETLNPEVHSCVQILNSANRRHFERAHVDEVICLDQIGANLAVASALNAGLSYLVSELLTFNSGSEFYRVTGSLVVEMTGKSYVEASQLLVERHMILLGVETDDLPRLRADLASDILHVVGRESQRVIVVNPQSEYRIGKDDALYCVAETFSA